MKHIQWNKVTWYSKFIALILFVAIPFVAFCYGIQYGKLLSYLDDSRPTALSPQSAIPYYADTASWQTIISGGGYSISYPIDFDVQDGYSLTPANDWRVDANNQAGIKYFVLTVPKVFEPQTNFSDAVLTVGASKTTKAIAECLQADPSGGPTTVTSSVTINNIPFTIFHTSSAGAGNLYETTSYRTVHTGKCYAIEYTVHSNQIENYPASYGLQPFNEGKIDVLMQNIIGTFKFL